MESLRPVFWGQGMFLLPQHFQQQDGYHEARLRRYLHALYPFGWGVKSLAINEAALRNFMFEIERCELVTWEGTIVQFQGESLPSNAKIAPRSFETALHPEGQPLSVFLGLRRWQWEEPNIAPSDGVPDLSPEAVQHSRFVVHETITPDLFAQQGPGSPLKYLVHEVHVLFEDEVAQSQDYELIKVAELVRTTEGQGAVLTRRYIPPCLSIYASTILAGMLKEVRDLLTVKGREMAEFKRQHGIRSIAARDVVSLFMMQAVNRYIPLFHHYIEVEETHPCVFYALLRQLVGEFSTFSESVAVLGGPLPAYRHDRLWECFDAAVQVIKRLLNELTSRPEYVVPLVFDGEYFAAALDRRFFEGNNHYYLSIRLDIPPRELLRRLTETGKISSMEDMAALRQQALFGLKIDYLDTPPEELPRRTHCRYFTIDHHTNLWKRIEQNQNIAVFCELPPEETEIQLLVISET
jgi:type VI secretion system protein ImpJ